MGTPKIVDKLLHAMEPDLGDQDQAPGWIVIGEMLQEKGDLMGSAMARRRASNIVVANQMSCTKASWKKNPPPRLRLSLPPRSPPVSPVMAAEASLRVAYLDWWQTTLSASNLAWETADTVSDAVGISVAPLVAPHASTEEPAESETEWPQLADTTAMELSPITSPHTSAEKSLQRYIHGLVWPWIGKSAPDAAWSSVASIDMPNTPSTPPPPPLHGPLPDPISPITPFCHGNLRVSCSERPADSFVKKAAVMQTHTGTRAPRSAL